MGVTILGLIGVGLSGCLTYAYFNDRNWILGTGCAGLCLGLLLLVYIGDVRNLCR